MNGQEKNQVRKTLEFVFKTWFHPDFGLFVVDHVLPSKAARIVCLDGKEWLVGKDVMNEAQALETITVQTLEEINQ